MDIGDLRIMSLNTIYYSLYNNYSSNDPGNQFNWMKKTLQNASENNKTVYIIGHLAPGCNVYHFQHLWVNKYVQIYISIISLYAPILRGKIKFFSIKENFTLKHLKRNCMDTHIGMNLRVPKIQFFIFFFKFFFFLF